MKDKINPKKKKEFFFYENKKAQKYQNEQDIYHLIYANEYSEAGKYYNQFTLNFTDKSYIYINDFRNYDVIQTIKERLIDKYEEIVKSKEKITMNSF